MKYYGDAQYVMKPKRMRLLRLSLGFKNLETLLVQIYPPRLTDYSKVPL